MSITNKSNEPLYLPINTTPLYGKYERLWGYIFNITDEAGNKVKFIGNFVDFKGPYNKVEDVNWRIDPGQTLTQKVNLPIDYDLNKGGVFKVKYQQEFLINPKVTDNGEIVGQSKRANSNVLTLWISSSLAAPVSQASRPALSEA